MMQLYNVKRIGYAFITLASFLFLFTTFGNVPKDTAKTGPEKILQKDPAHIKEPIPEPFKNELPEETSLPIPEPSQNNLIKDEKENEKIEIVSEDHENNLFKEESIEITDDYKEEEEPVKAIDIPTETPEIQNLTESKSSARDRIVRSIIIEGNVMVPDEVILSRTPYKVGEPFDPNKTRNLIQNLYSDLKRFRNVVISAELIGATEIDLYIEVQEKTPIKEFKFKDNSRVSEKEIKKKIDFSEIPALDEEELVIFANKIKKLYLEKNYHGAQVESKLKIADDKKGIATFTINEGKKSMVKRVRFRGNKNISSKELRSKIFTREDWPLSFLDNSGSYQPERIEGDRHFIEQFYQSNGYMMAKVTDVEIKMNPETQHFDIFFDIKEGDIFTVKEVKASGKEILKDDYIISRLPIQAGDLYSREMIVESIKALEMLWGEMGYIYAHVDPSIQPDEETKTVNMSFHVELGEKVHLNKINIIGNKKTRDKVIRRKLLLSEGQLLTNSRMEGSKSRVESLGFFDQRDGVNWRKIRVDENHADLDLILKETKTGRANLKIGFGGAGSSLKNPASGFSIGGEIADTNLFGSGIQLMLNAQWAKEEQSIVFNLTDPWLFDLPIMGSVDVYHKRPSYDDFQNARPVNEKLTGASGTVGFITPYLWETQIMARFGIDSVLYERKPEARVFEGCSLQERAKAETEFQAILDKLFSPGKYFWAGIHLGMDRRNHPIHTSRGYKWLGIYQAGIPSFGCNIGYHKFDLDMNWYTPLIGERDLVLRLHGYFGLLSPFKGRNIPYRELFHIGGPASVRGFLFGRVGPQFICDSIGGKKAFFVSAELAFPITPDFNMKGVVFYDGGSGWDFPYPCEVSKEFLTQNSFQFRHSVGVGIRIMNPMPIRIDWGFKLDRNKKLNETASEVHFGMSYDF